MSQGVYVLGGKCPGVSVQGVSVRGVYVLGVSVRGVYVRGGYVLEPSKTPSALPTSAFFHWGVVVRRKVSILKFSSSCPSLGLYLDGCHHC